MVEMETSRYREPEVGAESSKEEETIEEEVEEPAAAKVMKAVLSSLTKPKPDISSYTRSMNPEELIDWITEMDKFFEYEEMEEERKVEFTVTKLKGHVGIWWDGVQIERRRNNKQKIKNWDRMVAKLRGNFLTKFYQLTLFRSMQNLR